MNGLLRPRLAAETLRRHLDVMPAVVLSGARQTGKTTLAQQLTSMKRSFLTLDDLDVLDQLRRDPARLLSIPGPITLDEVQREPGVLLAVKREVDRDRRPGRFLLTGSANLLLMQGVSESLAGRASFLTLWPMTRREQAGEGACGLWEALASARDDEWLDVVDAEPAAAEDWRALARRGGYPTPAIQLDTAAERAVWFEGYTRSYLERDLQQLSTIAALPDYRRLMRAACLRIGQLVNQTELGRDVAVPQPTVHRWLNLLEASWLMVRLPAYAVNRTKRLIKAPKLYWGDVGLALHLAGGEPTGAHLENIVLHDLLCWRDARADRAEVLYWRTASGEEVDFVVEMNGRVLPIEVKATSRPRIADARHLESFRSEYGDASRAGLLLHTGSATKWLTDGVLAVPWWRVL